MITEFGLKVFGSIAMGFTFLYVANIVVTWVQYRLHKEKSALYYIGLSFFAGVYAIMNWAASIHKGLPFTVYVMNWMWVGGAGAMAFYFLCLFNFVNVKTKFARFIQGIAFFVFGMSLIAVTLSHLANFELFYDSIPRPDAPLLLQLAGGALATPTKVTEFIGSLSVLNSLVGLIYLLIKLSTRRPIDWLLVLGSSFVVLAVTSEILMSVGIIEVYPLMVFSKFLEICRIGVYYYRQTSEKLNRLQRELGAMAQKASAVFVTGGMVHDLKNPLSVVLSAVDLLKSEVATMHLEKSQVPALLAQIEKQGTRMANAIGSYLRLLKSGEHSELLPVNMQSVFDEALVLVGPRLKLRGVTDVSIEFSEKADGVLVQGNQVLLELVMANLINNSADALAGEKIKWIRIFVDVEQEFAVVRICDSGPGLSAEQEARVFTIGSTTKGPDGNGIGLRIVSQVMALHSGSVHYHRSSRGPEFLVKIPLVAAN